MYCWGTFPRRTSDRSDGDEDIFALVFAALKGRPGRSCRWNDLIAAGPDRLVRDRI
jgi:hypothetical protein